MQYDVDQRVDLPHRIARGLRLRPADVGLAMNDLPLQVRLVDDIEVDDTERADAGGREVHQRRRAQTARADDKDLRVLESLLPVHRDVGDDQVPAVPTHLIDRQVSGRLDERWQRFSPGHGSKLQVYDDVSYKRARSSRIPCYSLERHQPRRRLGASSAVPSAGSSPFA